MTLLPTRGRASRRLRVPYLALLCLVLPACSPVESPIRIDGSSTVYRISVAAQEGYSQTKPSSRVVVGNSGTGGGFGRYIEGEVDIIDASRPAKPEEESAARAKGLDWTRFLVGHDGITIAVNKKNTFVDKLTVEQLRQLYEAGSSVKTWKQLNPDWPDEAIVLYSPDDDSGTYDFFVEAIIKDKEKGQRKDVQASSDDNTLVQGISGDTNGIGYFGYAYFAANADKLRAVPVQAGADAPPVAPDNDSIFSGSYKPLARPLYIYVSNSALKRPEVFDFVSYYVKNLDTLPKAAGYVPPTESEQAENLKSLSSRGSGNPA